MKPTILSAGLILRKILMQSPDVTAITREIYPVVKNEARLPCVFYARESLTEGAVKGVTGPRAGHYVFACAAASYAESVALAEAVCAALNGATISDEETGLTMRGCHLIDADESGEPDAFVQALTFLVRV